MSSRTGRYVRGEAHPRHVLTEARIIQIRRDRRCGATLRELAQEHGVTKRTIQLIVQRRAWRHVRDHQEAA